MINYQEIYSYYHNLAMSYNFAQHQEDEEKQEVFGTQIFNLIMPLAQKIDPKLLKLIPKETLDKFKIEYDSDNIHIKSWEEIEVSYSSGSQNNNEYSDESGSNDSKQSSDQMISSNSQIIGSENDRNHNEENGNDTKDQNKLRDKGGQIGLSYDSIP